MTIFSQRLMLKLYMYSKFGFFSIIVLIFIGCKPNSSQSSDQVKKSVNNLLSKYESFTSSGNIDSIMSVYSNDPRFHWVEDEKVVYNSAKEVKNGIIGLQQTYSQSNLKLSQTKITPLDSDLASVTTHFKQSLADSSGNGFSFSGIMTIVAIKENGRWKFLIGHTSSPKQR